MTRKGNDLCRADSLSGFDLNTSQGKRGTARLRSSSIRTVSAFLTAIPGGRMIG